MVRIKPWFLWVFVLLTVGPGCGSLHCQYGSHGALKDKKEAPPAPVSKPPLTISVSGYGALDPSITNAIQQRLMGLRASKLDAYRALAERLRGVHISANSKVEDFLAQHDHLNAAVDAYVSQAKVVSQSINDMGACETVLSLELDPGFYQMIKTSDPVMSTMDQGSLSASGLASAKEMKGGNSTTAGLATMTVEQSQHDMIAPQDSVEVLPWGE